MITRVLGLALLAAAAVLGLLFGASTAADAATTPQLRPAAAERVLAVPTPPADPATRNGTNGPAGPQGPTGNPAGNPGGQVTVDLNGVNGKPSQSIVIMLGLTVLSVAPAILLLCTSFTKIFVVLSITRNALGLANVPPNQVLAGLALFISLFLMSPVASEINKDAVQPYLKGDKTVSQAIETGTPPLREFMVKQTRKEDLALFTKVADKQKPANAESVPMTTLVPAFVISELRAAFIIGFVIFIPFLIIDMVVSAALMSLGMMMLPPVTVALPFKLLLFVLVNGWGLIITALISSYR
ncbi:flagellar type III secretion system pore protein FliP [Spirillospora albida]|uniref:flagellar type III secretion system pore protein FliP n=1 Tax=Spirillospora albida TaxID=58123 RepID=UPI0004BEAED8|nr:flagellar type III secretion system pore protein FliP [Spirillospora albida]